MRRWTERVERSCDEALRAAAMAGGGAVEVKCTRAQSSRKRPAKPAGTGFEGWV
jgi:hypothetical protein